jgi:hypothetical protein
LRDHDRFGGRASAADHHAQLFGGRGHHYGLVGSQHRAAIQPRQCHRPQSGRAINGHADMHRPIRPRLAIFARAIDGIDNPDAALAQPCLIVLFLFGQQAVIGPGFTQGVTQELVGGLIARLAQRLGAEQTGRSNLDQYAPGHLRQMRGQIAVAHRPGIGSRAHGISLATIASAASSAVMAVVSIRISGSCGGS